MTSGFKARNGAGAKLASDGKLYTDDKYLPALRGLTYEIHIGTSSRNRTTDKTTITNLLAMKEQLKPYLYGDGEYAYIGEDLAFMFYVFLVLSMLLQSSSFLIDLNCLQVTYFLVTNVLPLESITLVRKMSRDCKPSV